MSTKRKRRVWYIGFYAHEGASERLHRLSAVSKMRYVAQVASELNYDVSVVSPSWVVSNNHPMMQGIRIVPGENFTRIIYLPCFSERGKFSKLFSSIFSQIITFLFILYKVRSNDIVINYHSPVSSTPSMLARRIVRFSYILQIEEIYSSVWKSTRRAKRREAWQISGADAYLLATDQLVTILDIKKPVSVIHGTYRSCHMSPAIDKRHSDHKLVYAGEIEETRKGAFQAVQLMKYLPKYYSLSIVGSGTQASIDKIASMISTANLELKRSAVTFLGELRGRDFETFLQEHSIGLNPQLTGDYMESAMPSKIMTYLVNGLSVVSTPVKSIIGSEIGPLVHFADDDTPESVARCILESNGVHTNAEIEIQKMHQRFKDRFSELLNRAVFAVGSDT